MAEMKKEYNPIIAAFSYSIGNTIIKAIPFITLPIFTRILSTSDFGLYNTYLAYESILSIVLGFGLSSTVRIAKVQYPSSFENYISSIYGLQFTITIIADVVLYLLFVLINPSIWLSKTVCIILLLNCLFTQFYNIGTTKYAINGEVSRNIVVSLLYTVLNVGISLFLCSFVFQNNAYCGRIIGTLLGSVIASLFIFVNQISKSHMFFNKDYWSFGLRMGLPLIIHALSLTLLSQCDKIMIQSMVGDSEAGIYGLAVTLIGIITVIVNSVDSAWAPWFFSELEKGKYTHVCKNNNYIIAAFSGMIVMIMLISPELIKLFSDVQYWDSRYAFAPLSLSVLFSFYYLIPVNFEYYMKKTGFIAISTLITAIINLILNYFLILTYGYISAAYATCLSKAILFVFHWLRARSLSNIRLLNMRWVVLCSIISLIICIFVVTTESIIIRYSVLLMIIVALLLVLIKMNVFCAIKSYIKKSVLNRR